MKLVPKIRKILRPEISMEEYAELEKKYSSIVILKESDDFKFIMDFFLSRQKEDADIVLENRLRDKSDRFLVGESLIRTLTQPKEEQLLELSGEYKLIKDFLSMLDSIENQYKEAQKKRNAGNNI